MPGLRCLGLAGLQVCRKMGSVPDTDSHTEVQVVTSEPGGRQPATSFRMYQFVYATSIESSFATFGRLANAP
jgi:hypothetical protein